MHDVYLGIDNGVSGSIGLIGDGYDTEFFKTPTKSEQSYTKKKANITRIDMIKLEEALEHIIGHDVLAVLERPCVNPGRFKTTMSAMRALEATLCFLEVNGIALMYVDSKQWQKVVLPNGIKGSPELKKASLDIGKRLYPQFADKIQKQKDADGILIAHWAYMEKL